MEALSAWCGKSLLAACIGVTLAIWPVSAARAESLTVRLKDEAADRGSLTAGSPACEFAPTQAKPPKAQKAEGPPAVGNLLTLFAAGTVLFGDSPSDVSPPPSTPIQPTAPITPTGPIDNPPAPITPGPPSSPLTPNTPPTGGIVIIQGNPTPEPASLIIGLIGSACAGAAVWDRRRKRAVTA